MYKEFRVSGRYVAKHPDGRYSTDLGVGATVFAKDEKDAKHIVAKKTMNTYGYINFEWQSVSINNKSLAG
ncbi:MAG: hypothetical protein AAF490_00445 [Chloroflexota bacterium]